MSSITTPLQGVIFDVDGTILDSMHPQYAWLRQTAERYEGRSPFPEFGRAFLKDYNDWYERKGMPGLYEMIGVDFHKHRDEIWRDYNTFNRTHAIGPVEGVENAVREIFERSRVSRVRPNALRLGANTTKSWKDIEIPLRNCGVLGCLDTVVAKDDVYNYCTDGEARRKSVPFDDYATLRTLVPEQMVRELEKPNSLASMLAVARLGAEPASIIAFEDTALGVQSCKSVLLPRRRSDLYVVGVTWGYQDRDELAAAKPDEIIDTPAQLVQLIGDLGGYS